MYFGSSPPPECTATLFLYIRLYTNEGCKGVNNVAVYSRMETLILDFQKEISKMTVFVSV